MISVSKHPYFSIIIPTYARPKQLSTCLHALTQLCYPRERFEVIVVDDGSEVPIEPVVEPFCKQLDLILLNQANAGPAAARNTGAEHAKGQFLAFTDDDCSPAPNWLSVLAKQFVQTPDRIIGGHTINELSNNLYASTSQLIVDIVYRHYNVNPNEARFFASNNLAVTAKQFREMGGFDPHFRISEDRELCDRWLFHGYHMTYAPEAIVYHAHDLNFWGFCKQHFSYGRGAHRFHSLRSKRGSGTIHGEMKFHSNLRNWLLYPFREMKGNHTLTFAFLLIIWQGINAMGFFWEKFYHSLGHRD